MSSSSLPPISPRSRGNSGLGLEPGVPVVEERERRSRGNSQHDISDSRASVAAVAPSTTTTSTASTASGGYLHMSAEASLSSVELTQSRREYNCKLFSRDFFIEFIKEEFYSAFLKTDRHSQYMQKCILIEELVEEHLRDPIRSRLRREVPTIANFYTRLEIRKAFDIIDKESNISKRTQIPPSFAEIKDLLNLAQVLATGSRLGLATFDGDGTLYEDGENFGDKKNGTKSGYVEIGQHIADLLRRGVFVSVVTAAGYGLEGPKYELRLRALLDMFVSLGLTKDMASRFFVLGGQCNYLLQCTYVPDESGQNIAKLLPVKYEEWQAESLGGPRPFYWPKDAVEQVLNIADAVMKEAASPNSPDSDSKVFSCESVFIRKERTVGLISKEPKMFKREQLNEVCFRVFDAMIKAQPPISVPYCVFNGGHDVWCDIGNKGIGISALQRYLNIAPSQSIHFGDQLLRQGNDIAAREAGGTIWVANPNETILNLRRISEISNSI